ncbi:glycerophosphodiester phosphodiesterase [Ralstonia sp. CHL-2022]|uniref:Glycerophosphodiester phosphodiesterase n=1 Tax=Ralstonia mojiangensis TaxID=2953895 RepID=A0AAE3I2L4_9RALS|nr:glycerophosphodiester phosphodiesterase [Ralstonia mojiangensis]MCT7316620.1 glycerophosphodiester phosphodiesterase [Ralstonia mojiangensis]
MTGARALPDWPYPRAIAHRGAGKLAPENTLGAFRHGASFGYRMFEFDVKLSGDGASVLLHDATLDRTTNGAGRLDALTLGQIAQLDAGSWHSAAYAGEPVPTLAAIARYLRANNFLANIEIKPVPGAEWRTGAAVALDARALWAGADVPPLLSSFSEDALAAAREAVPELPRALLLDKLPADWLDRLRALDCVALDANHRELTPEIIDAAHAAGFRVCCYTVNDLDRAQLLWSAGLDGLITDWVDRISPA